jgi:VWFA-related protein
MIRRSFLATLAATPAALGQSSPPAPAKLPAVVDALKVSVNEVIVPVTVTDEKGRFVSDLDKGDFTILDEGKPQQITYFNRERQQPVVAGFLLDMSNAQRLHWSKFLDAAQC